MVCGCCVKLVASLLPSFDSHAMTASDPSGSPSPKSLHLRWKEQGIPSIPASHWRAHANTHAYINFYTYSCILFRFSPSSPYSLSLLHIPFLSLLWSLHKHSHSCTDQSSYMDFTTPSSPHNQDDLFTSYVNVANVPISPQSFIFHT